MLFVKEFLGHKKLGTTLLFIQIEQALFKETSEEFTGKVAKAHEEIKLLLEVGFEYYARRTAQCSLAKASRVWFYGVKLKLRAVDHDFVSNFPFEGLCSVALIYGYF